MPNTTKSNKLKRKRGKKFVWHGSRDVNDQKSNFKPSPSQANPFEDHEKSKRARKDIDKRAELLNDFRRLNKNSAIVDNRIGESSSKLIEEDKMKLFSQKKTKEENSNKVLKNDYINAVYTRDKELIIEGGSQH